MSSPAEILKRYWGHDSFRPMQEDIIDAALRGEDVLAMLPTGGGKSVCFQVPAMLRDGVAVVITPLVALMKDQVQNLAARGIRAEALHAGMTRREMDTVLNNTAFGDVKFLYVSPERLSSPLFLSWLVEMRVCFIVVDEAHCISQWGYDFRPDYLRIGEIRTRVEAPLIALTATATPEVVTDIMDKLSFGKPLVLKSSFERPNLSYVVRQCEDKNGQLLAICRAVPGSGIVYMRHRRRCEEIAAFMKEQGIEASFYHAGLPPSERSERQEAWKRGDIRVMVCTNAFGMGIDKPDVRFVVHLEVPDGIESYFQEAGRAGRDGKRSYAVLLWNARDIRRQRDLLEGSFPTLETIEDIYYKLHVFYDIPYNAGEGRRLMFDIKAFASRFSLNIATVRNSLRYLERSDHISWSEDVDTSTLVRFTVEREALYGIDLPESGMETVLEQLMRNYTGIFSHLVAIDEDALASACGLGIPRLRVLLYRLSLEHVIRYVPCDHGDVIVLHHSRLEPGNLDLKPALHARLRQTAEKRFEAIAAYAMSADTCRSRLLLSYFGQTDSADCGHCDVCLSNRKTK